MEESAAFGHLSSEDRSALREILLDTKPSFRDWWEERELEIAGVLNF